MNRQQLAHVLSAAAKIVDDPAIVVLGSQAILGSHPEDDLPTEATLSVEADVAFWDDPGDAKADDLDGAIGEESQFHQTFGYYAPGVTVSTAVLPTGWQERVVEFDAGTSSQSVCLEKHDLVVSKLVAGREKDLSFATALVAAGLVDEDLLLARASALPLPDGARSRVRTGSGAVPGATRTIHRRQGDRNVVVPTKDGTVSAAKVASDLHFVVGTGVDPVTFRFSGGRSAD